MVLERIAIELAVFLLGSLGEAKGDTSVVRITSRSTGWCTGSGRGLTNGGEVARESTIDATIKVGIGIGLHSERTALLRLHARDSSGVSRADGYKAGEKTAEKHNVDYNE